jgi:hypothetical protein
MKKSPRLVSDDILRSLRDIGWEVWDPIGINELPGRPDDEYDRYLIRAWQMAQVGDDPFKIAAYLRMISRDSMALSVSDVRDEGAANAAQRICGLLNADVRNRAGTGLPVAAQKSGSQE